MIKLQSSIGSASYGLKVTNSDTDIYLLGNGSYTVPEGIKPHILIDTDDNFIKKSLLKGSFQNPLFLQTLFPESFLLETNLSNFILETREEIIKNNLKTIGNVYSKIGKMFLSDIEHYYDFASKRISYGLLFLNTLEKYSNEDITWKEASICKDDFKELLLSVRNKSLSLKEVKALSEEKINNLENVLTFYTNNNSNYLNFWENEALNLLKEEKENIKNANN